MVRREGADERRLDRGACLHHSRDKKIGGGLIECLLAPARSRRSSAQIQFHNIYCLGSGQTMLLINLLGTVERSSNVHIVPATIDNSQAPSYGFIESDHRLISISFEIGWLPQGLGG